MTEEERDDLRRREVAALEAIADKPLPTQRTWKDWWYGVPPGQEHMRGTYYLRHMRMDY